MVRLPEEIWKGRGEDVKGNGLKEETKDLSALQKDRLPDDVSC